MMRGSWFAVVAAVALAALAACDEKGELGNDKELAARLVQVRTKMHTAYAATTGIRAALVTGNLTRVKDDARIVAGLADVEVLAEWRPYVNNVRAAALQLAAAEDPITAAKQLALLGWRCAQCHEAVPSKTALPEVGRPPPGPKLSATMAAHEWAASRMWNGLVGSSTETWNEGAAALESARLAITAEGEVPGHELGIADDVSRIHNFARRAQKTGSTFDRAELYGELLATCVRCHRTIRD